MLTASDANTSPARLQPKKIGTCDSNHTLSFADRDDRANRLANGRFEFEFSRDATGPPVVPMCHANSLYFGLTFMYLGATVVVDDDKGFDPEDQLDTLARNDTKFAILRHFTNSRLCELYWATEAGLLDCCRERSAGCNRPRSIVFIAAADLPRIATGKIVHRTLRERIVIAATS